MKKVIRIIGGNRFINSLVTGRSVYSGRYNLSGTEAIFGASEYSRAPTFSELASQATETIDLSPNSPEMRTIIAEQEIIFKASVIKNYGTSATARMFAKYDRNLHYSMERNMEREVLRASLSFYLNQLENFPYVTVNYNDCVKKSFIKIEIENKESDLKAAKLKICNFLNNQGVAHGFVAITQGVINEITGKYHCFNLSD